MSLRFKTDIHKYGFLVDPGHRSFYDFILLWPLLEAFSVEICKFAALLLDIQILLFTVFCSVEPFEINHETIPPGHFSCSFLTTAYRVEAW